MASVEDCSSNWNNSLDYSYGFSYTSESHTLDASEKAVKAITIILLIVVTVFGAIGNSLVLLSLTIGTRKLGITSILLGSLAFTDFCINVYVVPIDIVHIHNPVWNLGPVLCVFSGFLSVFAQSSSACMLLAISCERFLVILYPLTSRTMLTRRRTFILVLLTWIISAGLAAFPASYKEVIPHPCSEIQFCTTQYQVGGDRRMQLLMFFYALVILYVIPLGGMTIANTCVIRALVKSNKYTKKLQSVKSLEKGVKYSASRKNDEGAAFVEKSICNNNSTDPVGEEKMDSMVTSGSGDDPFPPVTKVKEKAKSKHKSHTSVAQRKQVVMMLIAVVFLFAICWLPYFLFGTVYILFQVPPHIFGMIVFEAFAKICYSCNSALNPIVYGFMSKNFRQRILHGLRRCVRCMFRRNDGANSFHSAYTLSTRGSAMSQSTRQTRYSAVTKA